MEGGPSEKREGGIEREREEIMQECGSKTRIKREYEKGEQIIQIQAMK